MYGRPLHSVKSVSKGYLAARELKGPTVAALGLGVRIVLVSALPGGGLSPIIRVQSRWLTFFFLPKRSFVSSS